MKKTRIALSLLAAFAMAACANNGANSATAVNTNCPMNPAHEADQALTKDFNGQKVAFCCEKCMPKWEALSDADKQAKLSGSMPQK